jgi:hypothetical protein
VAVSRRRGPELRKPALLFLAGTAVLIAGGLHFRSGWAGSGTHPWTHQAMGPGGAARSCGHQPWPCPPTGLTRAFCSASPSARSPGWSLARWRSSLPLPEQPRSCDASTSPVRLLRFANYIARAISVSLGLFVFGTLTWLLDGGPGPSNLFQAGTVDQIGLAVMTSTLGLAALSVHRTATSPLLRVS